MKKSNASTIVNYLCQQLCIGQKHIVHKCYHCHLCKWICRLCGRLSTNLQYAYATQSHSFMCIQHFIDYSFPIIHSICQGILSIYDIKSNSKTLLHLTQSINKDAETISFQSRIFILGGWPPSSDVYEINLETLSLMKRHSMLRKKYFHSLCKANCYIYSIGGYSKTVCLSDCQKYSILHDKWESLPNLQTKRRLSATFSFNSKEIYTLAG